MSTSQVQPKVQRRTLKGHCKPVLCLSHSSERCLPSLSCRNNDTNIHHHHPPCLLLSGSEDGTARLWDLRSRRTSLCMILPPACTTTANFGSNDDGSIKGTKSLQSYAADQSVNCVAFHPLSFANNEESTRSRNCYNNHDNDNDVISAVAAAAAAEVYNNPCMVYATNSNRIYCYDIRQYTTPIVSSTASAAASSPVSSQTIPIIKTPHLDLTLQFQCIDEINQLSFSYPNSNKMNNTLESSHLCMATVDDSGEARVMLNYDTYYDERMSRNNTTTMALQHAKPETLSIASCAAFRPKQHPGKKKSNYNNDGISYLATAGTDCTIKLWDIDMSDNGNNNSSSSSKSTIRIRHRPPTSTITFGPHDDDNNDNDNVTAAAGTRSTMSTTMKLCNPPYVHSLSWSISGKYLAAGVGDGSIAILRAEGHRLVKVARFCNGSNNSSCNEEKEGHTSAVAAVHYPSFERIVESSRDDGDEHMSTLNIKNRDAVSIDEEERLLISAGNDGKIIFWDIGQHKDKAKIMSLSIPSNKTTEQKTRTGGAVRQSLLSPSILFRISHGHKPNWITSSRSMDAALPNSIFVADTTNNISVYTLPM